MDYIKQPVVIEDTAPPGHREAVAQAFARVGFDVEVEAVYGRRSTGLLPWIVQVDLLLPVKLFFVAFVGAAGKSAGEDAYAGVKKWVQDVGGARSGAGTGEGSIEVRDPDHTSVILRPPLTEWLSGKYARTTSSGTR